jgi:hypothetical protein
LEEVEIVLLRLVGLLQVGGGGGGGGFKVRVRARVRVRVRVDEREVIQVVTPKRVDVF